MRCVFSNQVLEVIERTRMQAKPDADWSAAEPINGNGRGDTPHHSSRRSSPMSSGRSGRGESGLNTPLMSPASTPRKEERPDGAAGGVPEQMLR